MTKEIVFHAIRHGQTVWNVEKRIQGHTDIPLSARGLTEVHSLGRELQEKKGEMRLDLIYSSDLARALVTADVLSYYLELPHRVDSRLRERHYGEFEGRTWEDLEREFGLDRIEGYQPEGGEALDEFDTRIKGAVTDILRMNLGKTVLFVSHGGVIRSKLKQFGNNTGIDGIGFDIKNLSMHTFSIPELALSIGSAK